MEDLNDFLMTNTVPEELRALYDVIEETCKSPKSLFFIEFSKLFWALLSNVVYILIPQ